MITLISIPKEKGADMISYSYSYSENLIRISLLFLAEQQVQIHSRHLKSPSAARLALSAVPVFEVLFVL